MAKGKAANPQHNDSGGQKPGRDALPPPLSRTATAAILLAICCTAIAIRLIAVARFEATLLEFSAYKHLRASKFLAQEGLASFRDWFDDRTWFPLGRDIGGTAHLGLAAAAVAARGAITTARALHALGSQWRATCSPRGTARGKCRHVQDRV